jgi:predicted NBD/HSP70 family sugar kinase/biotin operon repressor
VWDDVQWAAPRVTPAARILQAFVRHSLVERRDDRPLSKPELVRSLELAPATVKDHVDALLDAGLLVDDGTAFRERPKGRRAQGLKLNRSAGHVLVIGIGHRRVAVGLADLTGSFVRGAALRPQWDGIQNESGEWISNELNADAAAEQVLERAVGVAEAMLDSIDLRASDLVGICVSFPAPVAADGQPAEPGMMPGWATLDLSTEIADRLGVSLRVWVENDANLAALAETLWGAGRDVSSMLYVKWGSGTGCGLILNNDIVRSVRGFTGEFHVPLSDAQAAWIPKGTECPRCGARCLELAISPRSSPRSADRVELTNEGLAQLARKPTPELRNQARLLGYALGDRITMLDPDIVVIDVLGTQEGWSALHGDIRAGIENSTMPAVRRRLRLARSQLVPTTSLRGAVAYALRKELWGYLEARIPAAQAKRSTEEPRHDDESDAQTIDHVTRAEVSVT